MAACGVAGGRLPLHLLPLLADKEAWVLRKGTLSSYVSVKKLKTQNQLDASRAPFSTMVPGRAPGPLASRWGKLCGAKLLPSRGVGRVGRCSRASGCGQSLENHRKVANGSIDGVWAQTRLALARLDHQHNGHCLSLGGFLEALDPHGSEPLGQQLQLVRLGHVAGQGRPI